MKKLTAVLFLHAVLIFAGVVGWPVLAQTSSPPKFQDALPPYLQNPAADGMTICFLAQNAEAVTIDWHPTTETGEKKISVTGTKIPGTPWTVWKARLTKLQPGGTYGYRVRYRLDGKDEQTDVYQFCTLNPQAKSVRFAEVNDIHNHAETLAAMMKWVKPDDYEFMVLDGDMWTNPDSKNGAAQTFRSLNDYIQLCHGSEKPMIFVRGNHETIGDFADKMAYLFDMPALDATAKFSDQNWYYVLKAGPVWLLALDGGDDFTKRMEIFQPVRQRQTDWMREMFSQHAGADAAWRILVTHQPLYNDDWVTSEPCRQLWEPVLKTANIDLEINGHQHCLWKQREKGKTYEIEFKGHYPDQQDLQGRKHYSLTPLFPGIIGGGPSLEKEGAIKLIAADEKTLHVRLLAATDGRLLTEFKKEKK